MQEKKREKSTTTVREKERRTTLPALPCCPRARARARAPGTRRKERFPGRRERKTKRGVNKRGEVFPIHLMRVERRRRGLQIAIA
jgi:hypothetical protein